MLTLEGFIEEYAKSNDIPKTEARDEIERFISSFKTLTIENDGISINGFVESEIIEIPEKERMNPQTQEKFIKPKTKRIKVSAKPTFAKSLEK